jgi:transcriptional regulator with XRE-family HTH domain
MSEIEGFADRVFSLRRSAGKSQEELGAILGMTKSGVSSFEKGKSIPSPENLVKIASLFKVSVDYLLTGRGNAEGVSLAENNPEIHRIATSGGDQSTQELARHPDVMKNDLDGKQMLTKQVVDTNLSNTSDLVSEHLNQVSLNIPVAPAPLPIFDQVQLDKRFLTELDRLLKIGVFSSYRAWAQAVGVSPNYVAAIEKGRNHSSIELLYNTAQHFVEFDFTYVVFGSALSNRPEPSELPKRERGRRPNPNKAN